MSNFYANRVNSEHPIAVWPFDDDHQFISLIDEDDRNIVPISPGLWSGGTNTNNAASGTKASGVAFTHNPKDMPFPESHVTQLVPTTGGSGQFNVSGYTISSNLIYGFKSVSATYTWAANEIVVSLSNHGLAVGKKIYLDFTSGSAVDDTFSIISVTTNSFVVAKTGSGTGGNVTVKYSTVPISASLYVWTDAASIDYIDFGTSDSKTRNIIPSTAAQSWVKITAEEILPYSGQSIIIDIVRRPTATVDNSTVYFNGFSMGQYSEQSQSESLGTTVITPPTEIRSDNPSGNDTLPASGSVKVAAGTSLSMNDLKSYSVAKDYRLLAYNTGIPMVYGSKYAMRLRPLESPDEGAHPSLIFDGAGMFNEQGRYGTYTAEFWLRIGGASPESRKIFGPTMSTDGLYVCNGMFSLVVGGKAATANIGMMDAPHLIHIRYGGGKADLLVDGEKMATVEFDPKDLVLPVTTTAVDQKWLGFWAFADLDPIDIDCFSIFPYLVTEPVAKKHFVWGQGVTDVGFINSQFNGETFYSDGSTANFTHNVTYPDTAFWASGDYNNVKIGNDKIGIADRPLPEFAFSSKNLETFYQDLKTVQTGDGFFSFRPTASWSTPTPETAYMRFGSLDDFCNNTRGIAVRWSTPDTSETYTSVESLYVGLTYDDVSSLVLASFATYADLEGSVGSTVPIFLIRSKSNPSKMVYVYTDSVKMYASWIDGAAVTTLLQQNITINTEYTTFINFEGLITPETSEPIKNSMFSFLQNKADLEVLVAGDGSRTFAGKIFNVSFVDPSYKDVVEALVDPDDFVSNMAYSATYEPFDFCSYTLIPMNRHGSFYADIALRGYWEDYIPLQKLAGLTDASTEDFVSIDTIQMNIGLPTSSITTAPISPSGWTYADLASTYAGYPLSYLYYGFLTGYQTYDDLALRTSSSDPFNTIDTTNMFVRSYLSFQSSPKRMKKLDDLSGYYPATTGGVVYTDALPQPYDSKIEFVDGTVIVPPKKKNLQTAVMGVYLDFAVKGIKTYPVTVKSLEAASTVNSNKNFTPLGSKYGTSLYPYVSNTFGYDFNSVNPVRINKRGFPLFYRSGDSGIAPVGVQVEGTERGCFTYFGKTNESLEVDSLQVWARRETPFPSIEQNVFEINYTDSFYGIKDRKRLWFGLKALPYDNTRGVLKAYDENNLPVGDISFIQNGNSVLNPILNLKEWTAIGISFNSTARRELSSALMVKMHPGLTYENVSMFRPVELLGVTVNYRLWNEVDNQNWNYWVTSTWGQVLAPTVGEVKSKQVAKLVYDSYVGERVYVESSHRPLRINRGKSRVQSETSWSSQVLIPS